MRAIAAIRPDPTICISGKSGEGLPELLSLIASKLSAGLEVVEVLLPHTRGDLVEQVSWSRAGGSVRSAPYIVRCIRVTFGPQPYPSNVGDSLIHRSHVSYLPS